jgi:hypothetical protein
MNMKRTTSTIVATATLFSPALAFAINDLFEAEDFVIRILGQLGYLFWVMAIAFFFFGLAKFIANASDTSEHEKGKQFMVWGVIAFVVLASLWGIVSLILDDVGVTTSDINYVDRNGSTVP